MKRLCCTILSIFIAAFASGCSSNSPAVTESSAAATESVRENQTTTASSLPNAKREITDINGDKVTISADVKRVICRSGNGTSFLVGMGLGDKLVGTADYVVTNPWCDRFFSGISSLPTFGWSPSSEEVYSVNSDLVMVADPEVAANLRTDGITAICYKQYNEKEIITSANLLGEIFGENAAKYSERWLNYFNETNDYINSKIGTIKEEDKPVVYYIYGQSNKGLGRTAGGGSIIQVLIEGAGGKFSTADLPDDGPKITEEDAISRNPEVIFISGIYSEKLKNDLESSPQWQQVPAVKNKAVYQMPIGFISWDFYGLEYPLFKLWIAKQLYPELIDKDLHQETKQFHKDFYGADLTDNEVDYMLKALSPNGSPYETK